MFCWFVCFFVFRSPEFVAIDELLDWPTNSKTKLILALGANVRAAFAVMGGEFDKMSPADRSGKIGRNCLTTWGDHLCTVSAIQVELLEGTPGENGKMSDA